MRGCEDSLPDARSSDCSRQEWDVSPKPTPSVYSAADYISAFCLPTLLLPLSMLGAHIPSLLPLTRLCPLRHAISVSLGLASGLNFVHGSCQNWGLRIMPDDGRKPVNKDRAWSVSPTSVVVRLTRGTKSSWRDCES